MGPNPPNVAIDGDELRTRRKFAGYSQIELAEQAEITNRYVSEIERGNRKFVSPAVFVRLCDALDIRPDQRWKLVRSAVAS
jgi:transcriptional regulator with XRE-family HTH domain